MLEGKAVVGETDMLQTMQEDALDLAAKALDFYDATDATDIARFIKQEFDRMHGPGWQCVVGRDFGSFVTHCFGCFIHFQARVRQVKLRLSQNLIRRANHQFIYAQIAKSEIKEQLKRKKARHGQQKRLDNKICL